MAADRTEPRLRAVSLEELVALTDEMAALVHAGVPLESGLSNVSADLGGRNGEVANDLAARLRAGESLSHVLESSPSTFPPVFTAVVEAGLRSGRLSAALEGLAKSARRIADLRRLARRGHVISRFCSVFGIRVVCVGNRLVPAACDADVQSDGTDASAAEFAAG